LSSSDSSEAEDKRRKKSRREDGYLPFYHMMPPPYFGQQWPMMGQQQQSQMQMAWQQHQPQAQVSWQQQQPQTHMAWQVGAPSVLEPVDSQTVVVDTGSYVPQTEPVSSPEQEEECDNKEDQKEGYKKRLVKLCDVLELEVKVSKSVPNYSDAKARERVILPEAPFIRDSFNLYEGELNGVKGSRRYKKHPLRPMPMGEFPSFPRSAAYYEVHEPSWNIKTPYNNTNIVDSVLLEVKEKDKNKEERKKDYVPMVKPPLSALLAIEQDARDGISMASYASMFSLGLKRVLEFIENFASLKNVTEDDLDSLVSLARDGQEFNASVLRTLEDMVKAQIASAGTSVLMRRDAWLKAMNKDLGSQHKNVLRNADINQQFLFGEEKLEEVKKELRSEVLDKVHHDFLAKESGRKSDFRKSDFKARLEGRDRREVKPKNFNYNNYSNYNNYNKSQTEQFRSNRKEPRGRGRGGRKF
jgi:hypothetical protein